MVVGLDISLLSPIPHPFPSHPPAPELKSVFSWSRRTVSHSTCSDVLQFAAGYGETSSMRCRTELHRLLWPGATRPRVVTFSVHWLLNRASHNICDCTAFLQTAVLLLLQLFFDHRTTLWHRPSRRDLCDSDGFCEHVRKIVSSWPPENSPSKPRAS